MKNLKSLVLILAILISSVCFSQEETEGKSNSRISVIAYGGIGYGNVDNDREANYDLNSNYGDLIVNYRFSNHFGIASGVGLNQLTGNGFNSFGQFYHERDIVKIPLLLTVDNKIGNHFELFCYLGPYAQTIINDEYSFMNGKVKDVYEGWNFGFQLGLGFLYQVSDQFSAGLNYTGQSDFTNFETDTNQLINDEQKMKNLNIVGVMFILSF